MLQQPGVLVAQPLVVALAVGTVVLAFGDKPTWMEAPQRLAALLAEYKQQMAKEVERKAKRLEVYR